MINNNDNNNNKTIQSQSASSTATITPPLVNIGHAVPMQRWQRVTAPTRRAQQRSSQLLGDHRHCQFVHNPPALFRATSNTFELVIVGLAINPKMVLVEVWKTLQRTHRRHKYNGHLLRHPISVPLSPDRPMSASV